jgi:hypothetical protein
MKNTLNTEFRTRVQDKITQDLSSFMIMVIYSVSITIGYMSIRLSVQGVC